jgi:predicted acyltransferase
VAQVFEVIGLIPKVTGWLAQVVSPINASLLWAVSFTLLMYLFAYLLYRRGWFLRI